MPHGMQYPLPLFATSTPFPLFFLPLTNTTDLVIDQVASPVHIRRLVVGCCVE
jgi:hypothetical protein